MGEGEYWSRQGRTQVVLGSDKATEAVVNLFCVLVPRLSSALPRQCNCATKAGDVLVPIDFSYHTKINRSGHENSRARPCDWTAYQ